MSSPRSSDRSSHQGIRMWMQSRWSGCKLNRVRKGSGNTNPELCNRRHGNQEHSPHSRCLKHVLTTEWEIHINWNIDYSKKKRPIFTFKCRGKTQYVRGTATRFYWGCLKGSYCIYCTYRRKWRGRRRNGSRFGGSHKLLRFDRDDQREIQFHRSRGSKSCAKHTICCNTPKN